jgi:hypothetical protein
LRLTKEITIIASILTSFVIISVTLNFEIPKINAQQQLLDNNTIFTDRITKTSVLGIPSPGHEDHQIVMALPPKDDNKIWVGSVSWISSEPIEVGFLIKHNNSATDASHSNVETLHLGNENVEHASTNLTGKTDSHTFGTTNFVVDQLVFHSINNTKFTITYAIDAIAKEIK